MDLVVSTKKYQMPELCLRNNRFFSNIAAERPENYCKKNDDEAVDNRRNRCYCALPQLEPIFNFCFLIGSYFTGLN